MDKQDKIKGTLLFMKQLSKEKIAEYIVNQSDTIEGLQAINEEWVKAFKEIYKKKDACGVSKESMEEILKTPYYKEHPNCKFAKKLRKELKRRL